MTNNFRVLLFLFLFYISDKLLCENGFILLKDNSRIFFSLTNLVYHNCSCYLIKTVQTLLVSVTILLVCSSDINLIY